MNILLVGIGGALGAVARYLMGKWIMAFTAATVIPMGTLGVNMIGCFIIGICYVLAGKQVISPEMKLILMTGFLGGFTTFSSLELETMSLIREHHWGHALLDVFINVTVGLLFVALGIVLGGLLLKKNG